MHPEFESKSYPSLFFGERTMIVNPKAKKRPRNFYGANVAWLGVFQTESVIRSRRWTKTIEVRLKNSGGQEAEQGRSRQDKL